MTVLPFPLARRVGLIRKQAAFLSDASGSEGRLRRLLEQQAAALEAKGVPAVRVRAECLGLERAIRAEMFRLSKTGAAG